MSAGAPGCCLDCGAVLDDDDRVRCVPCSDVEFDRELTGRTERVIDAKVWVPTMSPAWTRLYAASSRVVEAREQLREVRGVRADRARRRLDEALCELTVLGWEVDRLDRFDKEAATKEKAP